MQCNVKAQLNIIYDRRFVFPIELCAMHKLYNFAVRFSSISTFFQSVGHQIFKPLGEVFNVLYEYCSTSLVAE